MSPSESEKARVEARKDVSGHITPGRYEGALARVLAGLAATDKAREERNEEQAEGDQPKPGGR